MIKAGIEYESGREKPRGRKKQKKGLEAPFFEITSAFI